MPGAELVLRARDLARLYEIRALPGVSHWLTQAPTSYQEYLERNDTVERLLIPDQKVPAQPLPALEITRR